MLASVFPYVLVSLVSFFEAPQQLWSVVHQGNHRGPGSRGVGSSDVSPMFLQKGAYWDVHVFKKY